MDSSSVTFFSVCVYSLVSFGLAYLELAWLYKSFSVGNLRRDLIMIGVVNFIYLCLVALQANTYYGLWTYLVFPFVPLIYVLIKIFIIRFIKHSNKTHLYAPLSLTILTVFSHFIISVCIASGIQNVNPTRENAEKVIQNKNNIMLEVMLWLTPFKEDDNMTRLVNEAIIYDNTEAIKILIRHNADPETSYWIDKAHSKEAVNIILKWQIDNAFLKKNYDLYSRNDQRFDWYCLSSSPEELKKFIAKGFKPKNVRSVIHKAIDFHEFKDAKASHEEIKELIEKIEILHEQGVSITETGYDYVGSPIFQVICSGHELDPVLAYLIEKGCPVNEQLEKTIYHKNGNNITGETPLMLAVIFNRASYVKMLLSRGADKSIKDRSGKTALDYAAETNVSETIRYELSIKR
jgi:hypothetical protein